MNTDITQALQIRRQFLAEYQKHTWLWFAELHMTDRGYVINAHVTSLVKADCTLPSEYMGLPVEWERVRM